MENAPFPVIDLFAGPGGLSEGFAAINDENDNRFFRIALSVEKDADAFQTLELRAFFRQFDGHEVPNEYYAYLRGQIEDRRELFKLFPEEYKSALQVVWHKELGSNDALQSAVDTRIRSALSGPNNRWVLIGGPPCQAYSIVGRSRMLGSDPIAYQNDHRHFLYREYLRILAFHQPPFFLMENVPGILTSKVNGEYIFTCILKDLQQPGKACCEYGYTKRDRGGSYRIFPLGANSDISTRPGEASKFVIQAEQYGIPQARHRVFLLGIRSGIKARPETLHALRRLITVRQAIEDLPPLRSSLSREEDNAASWARALKGIAKNGWLKAQGLESRIRSTIVSACYGLDTSLSTGGKFVPGTGKPTCFAEWYHDERLGGACNHSTRRHMRSDLHRYLFASCFAQIFKKSPQLKDFPMEFLPDHKNVANAIKSRRLFSDRFRVQLFDAPATTITCHIAKDGHYFIHPDPLQCRSLTVREAARIQTFPDNYFFEGSQTAQYEQVGNAVPPLLARAIAELVRDLILEDKKLSSDRAKRFQVKWDGKPVGKNL